MSRLLVRYALAKQDLPVSEKAIQLTPSDPQAHFAGAAVLSSVNRPAESLAQLEQAVALRPSDYSLWLQLGLLRDQLGQTEPALAAFDEAVRLAPFYARPKWLRGNLHLRAGRYETGFNDLAAAARSNPELVPALINLAWNLSKRDVNLTEQWARIDSGPVRLAFATFLARQGRPREGIAQFRAAGAVSDKVRRELVGQLIADGDFKEAMEVWNHRPGFSFEDQQLTTTFYDGGFEAPLRFDETGFGWRVPRDMQGVKLSLQSSESPSGSQNLRIDFGGDSSPGSDLVSQLILVEPSERYQINFASRSQDIVTGGLPVVVVTDAGVGHPRLGQSALLGGNRSNDWQISSFQFTAAANTRAVIVSLQRTNCSTSPCPIFGTISLDSFSAAKLK